MDDTWESFEGKRVEVIRQKLQEKINEWTDIQNIDENRLEQEITCDDILKELRAKQYRPVYYLMGEEPYYIDLIADYITDNILTETEKEFNLTVVYGADVDIATVINAAKRYPMMSEHQVVVVKAALRWVM